MGHNYGHGPLGIGHRGTVNMAHFAIDGHNHAELLAFAHGFPHFIHRGVDILQTILTSIGEQPVVAVIGREI